MEHKPAPENAAVTSPVQATLDKADVATTANDSSKSDSAQGSTRPSPAGQSLAGLARWKEVVVEILPSPIQEIVKKGLLRVLVVLVAAFVAFPLLVAFLAALWLTFLGKSDLGLVKSLRNAYLEVIHEGFTIEEVASRSHARLDYLQLFDAKLRAGAPSKELIINIQPGQLAAIDFAIVTFTSDGAACTVPEPDIELVSVALGEQPVKTLKHEQNVAVSIGKSWWKENLAKFEEGEPVRRLSFKLTEQVRKLKCGQVYIEGSVRVFKNLFPLPRS